jgi:hypothetical protein
VNVQAMEPERLEGFREVGADAPWPADAITQGWEYRLPIHVLNFTSQAFGNGLMKFIEGAAETYSDETGYNFNVE